MTWRGIILRGTDCATLSYTFYALNVIAEKLEVETTPVILILYFAPKTLLDFTKKDIASRNEEYASLIKFGSGKLPWCPTSPENSIKGERICEASRLTFVYTAGPTKRRFAGQFFLFFIFSIRWFGADGLQTKLLRLPGLYEGIRKANEYKSTPRAFWYVFSFIIL